MTTSTEPYVWLSRDGYWPECDTVVYGNGGVVLDGFVEAARDGEPEYEIAKVFLAYRQAYRKYGLVEI